MATDKRQFTLRLPDNVFEAVKLVAKKERRSIAVMIEVILEKYLLEYEGFEGEEHRQYYRALNGIPEDTN